MSKDEKVSSENQPMVERASDHCELTMSADHKWLRLVVGGKLIASFHVNYVNKVLGNVAKQSKNERLEKSDLDINP